MIKGLCLSDACVPSGNLGVDGEMVKGMASNLPSRSEGSEMRLADRGMTESFSPPSYVRNPLTRTKTFGVSGGDGPWERTAMVFGFSVSPFGVLRGGKADIQAGGRDKLRVDKRHFVSASPVLGRQSDRRKEVIIGYTPLSTGLYQGRPSA